jgi:hypothetical protein
MNSRAQKLIFSFTPGTEEIRIGQDISVQGDETRKGKVVNLYEDAKNGLSVAEAVLDSRMDLPANSYLSITVIQKTASGCAVPLRSLLHRTGGTGVMVYLNDRFTEQAVSVLARDREFAVVDPCSDGPVAVASEAKLSLLPAYGRISVFSGESNE